MKKKFAFILMGEHYNPNVNQSCFETEKQFTYIFTVRNFEEACEKVKQLDQDGFGAVELCGAFGEEKAKTLIGLTHNRMAVGFVVHLPSQDDIFAQFFGH